MRTAEALGYAHLVPPDHVLGVNPSADHSGRRVGTTANACHDPFVLFGFLSGCTQQICTATDYPSGEASGLTRTVVGWSFQLRIGVGWNEVEFVGLNENLRNRGKRSAAQVKVMQALWAGPHVRFAGEFHRIDNASINPRPASGRVPIWYGGHAEATFQRCAKYGDGYMPFVYPAGEAAVATFAKLRALTREVWRDPSAMGARGLGLPGLRRTRNRRREMFRRKAGVSHVTAHATYVAGHHKRIASRNAAEHLTAITRYREAVADLL